MIEKVKIKRVKRIHKKVTTKEKILGGLGLASTIFGGASQITPQQQKTQFVEMNKLADDFNTWKGKQGNS